MNLFFQAVSVLGAGLVLVAFYFLQRGRWTSHGRRYLWVNLFGAFLLTIVAIEDRRAGFIILEGAWTVVSAYGLWGRVDPR
ncbi:MAG: hypothetical protein O7I93_05120 [Gemmatimonadetes bacterium]|nr:hypothetical protein [Gemmatimonadota bacterium]